MQRTKGRKSTNQSKTVRNILAYIKFNFFPTDYFICHIVANYKCFSVRETLQSEKLKEDDMEVLQDIIKLEKKRESSEKSKSIVSESGKQEDSDCIIVYNV